MSPQFLNMEVFQFQFMEVFQLFEFNFNFISMVKYNKLSLLLNEPNVLPSCFFRYI